MTKSVHFFASSLLYKLADLCMGWLCQSALIELLLSTSKKQFFRLLQPKFCLNKKFLMPIAIMFHRGSKRSLVYYLARGTICLFFCLSMLCHFAKYHHKMCLRENTWVQDAFYIALVDEQACVLLKQDAKTSIYLVQLLKFIYILRQALAEDDLQLEWPALQILITVISTQVKLLALLSQWEHAEIKNHSVFCLQKQCKLHISHQPFSVFRIIF